MNRRGNLLDALPIVFILFLLAVFSVIFLYMFGVINDAFQASDLTSDAKTISGDFNGQISWVLDFIFVVILIGLPMISMILSFFNNIHPLLFWMSFGAVFLVIIMGASLGDLWTSINGTELSGAIGRMPMTNLVMSHFGMYSFLIVLLMMGGAFVKTRSSGGYLQ